MIGLIVAVDEKGGIGKNGKIPWHCSADLKRFKALTLNSAIIMGRKTWESIGGKNLPKRMNIVLTNQKKSDIRMIIQAEFIANSVEESFRYIMDSNGMTPVFFIGGSSVYKEGLKRADTIFMTEIQGNFDCDTFFPMEELEEFERREPTNWFEDEDKLGNKINYRFVEYYRKNERDKKI